MDAEVGHGAAGRFGAIAPPHPRRQRAREAVVGGEIPLDLGHPAERALVDQTLQARLAACLRRWWPTASTTPARRHASVARARIGDRERERFVDEDVLARGGRGHDVLGMRRVGRRDQHAFDLAIREHGVEGRQIAAPVGLREPRRGSRRSGWCTRRLLRPVPRPAASASVPPHRPVPIAATRTVIGTRPRGL